MSRVDPWWSGMAAHARAINDIDAALLAERRALRQQERRLTAATDSTRRDLRRVTARVDEMGVGAESVYEWVELRLRLMDHEAYRARTEIGDVFRSVFRRPPAALPEIEDSPGYWLPPAARAVLPLLVASRRSVEAAVRRGGLPGGPGSDLGTARKRDAIRTDLFLLATGMCFDRPAVAEEAVQRLLAAPVDFGGTDSGRVAAGWRVLWEHAARGVWGPGAVEQLAWRLETLADFTAVPASELSKWDRAIRHFGSAGAPSPTRAQAFTALRHHLTGARDVRAPARAPHVDDYWRALLDELLEEPGPAEQPLVQAMDKFRSASGAAGGRIPTWAVPTKPVVALVRRDLFAPDAPARSRDLALRVGGSLLRERLNSALRPPAPAVVTVGSDPPIEVTGTGHDPEQLARAEQRIMATSTAEHSCGDLLGVFAVSASVGVAALVFGEWAIALVCVIVAVVPLGVLYDRVVSDRRAAVARERALAGLRSALADARFDVAARNLRATRRYESDRQALQRLLGALPEGSSSEVFSTIPSQFFHRP